MEKRINLAYTGPWNRDKEFIIAVVLNGKLYSYHLFKSMEEAKMYNKRVYGGKFKPMTLVDATIDLHEYFYYEKYDKTKQNEPSYVQGAYEYKRSIRKVNKKKGLVQAAGSDSPVCVELHSPF